MDQGQPIYHTNVVMSVGTNWVVICFEVLTNVKEREFVREKLLETGKTIIEITAEQLGQFCANVSLCGFFHFGCY